MMIKVKTVLSLVCKKVLDRVPIRYGDFPINEDVVIPEINNDYYKR